MSNPPEPPIDLLGLIKLLFPDKTQKVVGCPKCGYTIENVAKSSRLGCAMCYDHFKKELLPIIIKVQENTYEHVGKQPKNRKFTTEELKNQLQIAISKEEYEKAAEIKKLIEKP